MLAVLMYQHDDNPDGLPDAWPSQVREIDDVSESPGEPWVIMTKEDYETYRNQNMSLYDEWRANQ